MHCSCNDVFSCNISNPLLTSLWAMSNLSIYAQTSLKVYFEIIINEKILWDGDSTIKFLFSKTAFMSYKFRVRHTPYGKFTHDFTYEIFICEIVMWNWNNSYMKFSHMKVSHMKFSYVKSVSLMNGPNST